MPLNTEIFAKNSAVSIERMRLKISVSALNDLFGSGVLSEQDYKVWLAHYNSKFIQRYDEINSISSDKFSSD
jgi:hypothetical protein